MFSIKFISDQTLLLSPLNSVLPLLKFSCYPYQLQALFDLSLDWFIGFCPLSFSTVTTLMTKLKAVMFL